MTSVNAREVLQYLNDLGYVNITTQQLKSFITDLKKLIKYERKENAENIPPSLRYDYPSNCTVNYALPTESWRHKQKVAQTQVPRVVFKICEEGNKYACSTNIPSTSKNKIFDQKFKISENSNKYPCSPNLLTTSKNNVIFDRRNISQPVAATKGVTIPTNILAKSALRSNILSRSKSIPSSSKSSLYTNTSSSKDTSRSLSAGSTQTYGPKCFSPIYNNRASTLTSLETQETQTQVFSFPKTACGSKCVFVQTAKNSSAQNLFKNECKVVRTRSKSWENLPRVSKFCVKYKPRPVLLPQPLSKYKRCDPVTLYHKYKEQWKKHKVPGENNYSDLRRTVRERLLGPPPESWVVTPTMDWICKQHAPPIGGCL